MGKKGTKRKISETEHEEIAEEHDANELEAELKALAAMRAEKQGEAASSNPAGRTGSYNKEGLLRALGSLKTQSLPFIETLQISDFSIAINDDNDDLEREIAFYNQSLEAVKEGRTRLKALGVAIRRPDDFFCENVKTDTHMNRIKDRLILEEKKIDGFEKRKQREISRKYDKQVADMRKQEKVKRVKTEMNEVSDIRKGGAAVEDRKQRLDNVLSSGGPGGKSKKRSIMDKKYGSGIKEKMKAKLNDKKSLNDFTDFNPRGGKLVRRERKGAGGPGGKGGAGAGGKAGGRGRGGDREGGGRPAGRPGRAKSASASKPNRPGKDARTKMRSNRST